MTSRNPAKPPIPLLPPEQKPISLKLLAEYLDLSPATVSVVLNNVPGRSISEPTRQRIREAAKKFNYRPSLLAQSLRRKQSFTIGVLLPEISDGYHAQVMSGIADYLMREGYFYLIAHHRHRADLVREYAHMLVARGAEGIVAIDTHFTESPPVPVIAVAGHDMMEGVTNVILDHERAAHLTLKHLYSLGHRQIAYIKGQPNSSDTDIRWQTTVAAAKSLGLAIPDEMVMQLEEDVTTPEITYPLVERLVAQKRPFTAIVCFNDIAAIGALRALHDAGRRTPEDVSVVGFDDIRMAAFSTPSITTIRQPLQRMGESAAKILLDRLLGRQSHPAEVAVEPELVIRESTCPPPR